MKVYNKRDTAIPAGAVYVGRPTKFGNPFTHVNNHKTLAAYIVDTRAEAVKQFEEWLLKQPALVSAVKKELKGKNLVCWCAPLSCHADVLMRIANED
jgi:hypothetical protein